ncbi:MAG: PilW family protein [Gammaproteobacteria bacterium]|nr:PilW family protein [Gammaproteobacteria bacterium]
MKMNFSKQSGFSLVELMVAGLLGLLLLGGVISVFMGSKRSFTMQEQLANLQTDGRFAMLYIEQTARNSGWFEGAIDSSADAVMPVDIALSSEGADGAPDAITFVRQAIVDTGIDCNGSTVTGRVVRNRFFQQNNSLFCQGNGGAAAQPVINNIETFQVLYGVDNDGDAVVDTYIDAGDVSTGALTGSVIAVQIGLVVRSDENFSFDVPATTINVLDESFDFTDNRIRRNFSKTIAMPNAAFAIISSPSQ